jgi:hypothetical protein
LLKIVKVIKSFHIYIFIIPFEAVKTRFTGAFSFVLRQVDFKMREQLDLYH